MYKGSELAKWFNISSTTFYHSKDKKLEELKKYCVFEDLGKKGIKVIKVITPEYVKSTAKNIVSKYFDETWNRNGEGLNTCKQTAYDIYNEHRDEITVKLSTIETATRMQKTEWYGTNKGEGGTKGYAKYTFSALNLETLKWRHLTPEEEAIRSQLAKKYYKEKCEEIEKLVASKKDYDNNLIDKNEYDAIVVDSVVNIEQTWDSMQREFELIIGCTCAFKTELLPCAFSMKD